MQQLLLEHGTLYSRWMVRVMLRIVWLFLSKVCLGSTTRTKILIILGLECLEKLIEENLNWKFFLNTVGSALPGIPENFNY